MGMLHHDFLHFFLGIKHVDLDFKDVGYYQKMGCDSLATDIGGAEEQGQGW